jgi:putative DNA methylase
VARAVLLASILDDPSSRPDEFPTADDQNRERRRLFGLIERLVVWESGGDAELIGTARAELHRATAGDLPLVTDPFSGGATIPLEAQRLGLPTQGSDLNPVAVLIAKALSQLPQRHAGRAPAHPEARNRLGQQGAWPGTTGLTEDVRRYGAWMRGEAERRLARLYPPVTLENGSKAPVIAWLWARTVTCPNPACRAEVPLVRSFTVSTKRGSEHWMRPEADRASGRVRFMIASGRAPIEGTVTRSGARCIACDEPIPLEHIRLEGRAHRLGAQLMATVAEVAGRRTYLSPTEEQEQAARQVTPPPDLLDDELPPQALGFRVQGYGMTRHRDLYTARQLVTLETLSDLVSEAAERVRGDSGDDVAYARAIATYLAFIVDKVAQFNSVLVLWYSKEDRQKDTFARQALPMTWDFAEGNVFAGVGGGLDVAIKTVADALAGVPADAAPARVRQGDAATVLAESAPPCLVSTDPPYYDNVPYADLSDFFYVWLRRSLRPVDPEFLDTLLVPKSDELIAEPARFDGNRHAAKAFFESGMRRFFDVATKVADDRFPTTVYYAFKQAETIVDSGTASTGWETMLTGLIDSGFEVTGTWPTRTERTGRLRDTGSNALASSVVLVCRVRPSDAPWATRKQVLDALKSELSEALRVLQHGNIAPVDLAQAAIGPGMTIFSRYGRVVEADGSAMTVRTALSLINGALDEILAEQEGDFDAGTRFAIAWFEQYGTGEGAHGQADVLARAKNSAVGALEEAEILASAGGKVRLLARPELRDDWDPATDHRVTVWEVAQQLVKRLEESGEEAAGELLRRVGGLGQAAHDLSYRLYGICERKGWAQEALGYNALVVAWPELLRIASGAPPGSQETLEV